MELNKTLRALSLHGLSKLPRKVRAEIIEALNKGLPIQEKVLDDIITVAQKQLQDQEGTTLQARHIDKLLHPPDIAAIWSRFLELEKRMDKIESKSKPIKHLVSRPIKLNPNMEYIIENQDKTINEIASVRNIQTKTVQSYQSKLRSKGLLPK